MRKLDSFGIAEYFDNDRIRWVVSLIIYFICGAAPFIPTVTGAGTYNDISINKVSQSLHFYWSGIGLDFYPAVVTLYAVVGAVFLVWGLVKRPPFIGGIVVTALSVIFLLFNLLAGGIIFYSVSYAGIDETCTLSVWGIVYLVVQAVSIVNLCAFLPKLKSAEKK